jgi:uncharacterized membrane protein
MDDDRTFFYGPRGSGKSRFTALSEIDFLYRTGRLSFEDYLNFMGEALIRLFGQSEEFVEDMKEKARKNRHT